MFKKLFSGELFRGSFILISLIFLGNVLSYVFQFTMAWMLGPEDYSILATITSIIAIFGISTLSLQTIIAKRTTELRVQKKIGNIKWMFKFLAFKTFLFSLISFGIFSLISYLWLSKYLKISFPLLILTGIFIFGAFLYPVAAGILQGTKKFKGLGFSFIVNGLFKLIVGSSLVFIGWKVYGAVLGFIVGIMMSFIVIFPFLRDIWVVEESEEKFELFSNTNLFTFFAIILFILMYSLDVIFAKAFFSAQISGEYAVISLLGKIILFLNMSIGNVMFPINSERFICGKETKGIFNKSLLLVFLICGFSLLIFFLFPEFVVNTLFGEKYAAGEGILFYVGFAFSSISLLNIFVLNTISKNEFKFPQLGFLLISLIIQIALLSLFHKTIIQFSIAFMVSTTITLLGSIFFLNPPREYF